MRYSCGLIALGLVAACGFPQPALLGSGDADDQPGGSDAGTKHDAGSGSDQHDAGPPCYGAPGSFYEVCLAAAPSTDLVNPGQLTVSTATTSTQCATNVIKPNDGSLCVLAYNSITLQDGDTIAANGTRPLVIIAAQTFSIGGGATIDAGSHSAGTAGPGNTIGTCNAGAASSTNGAAGAGGSFFSSGGNGGTGQGGGVISQAGATITQPAALRGGCPGYGGMPGFNNGGTGGGVVALITPGTLTIDGVVSSGGKAGAGGADTGGTFQGGGGAGTGGMIQIDANTIKGSGIIEAPGGGGGQGASNNAGANFPGAAGSDPGIQPGNLTIANGASGGSTSGVGGFGGNGGSSSSPSGAPGKSTTTGSSTGAGGGGGGCGWILIHDGAGGISFTGTIFPPSVSN